MRSSFFGLHRFQEENSFLLCGKTLTTSYLELDQLLLDLLEKLCFIQMKTGIRFTLPSLQFDEETVNDIEVAYSILATGSVELQGTEIMPTFDKNTVRLALEAVHRGMGITHSTKRAETTATLLGIEIPLGEGDWDTSVVPLLSESELQQIVDEMKEDDTRPIKVRILEGKATFPKWKN
jgi:hypothetical protein